MRMVDHIRFCILIVTIFGLLLKGFEASTYNSTFKVVIDHDGGADDAMAIAMCLLYEKYFDGPIVTALTTTHGNVNESQAFRNSQIFLQITDRQDVPIYRGAAQSLVVQVPSDLFFGIDGLGDNKQTFTDLTTESQNLPAALSLIELSKIYEGNLVVLAIGPLMNIALAQTLDPDFISRLSQLYVGGGTIHSANNSKPEFNAKVDAEAYRIVMNNANVDKVTLVPISQISDSLNLNRVWRINQLGAIKTPLMKTLNQFERISLTKNKKWSLLDPAVAAVMLCNNIVSEYKLSKNNITLCGVERGINTNELDAVDANTRLVYSIIEENYQKLLINIFSAELKKKN